MHIAAVVGTLKVEKVSLNIVIKATSSYGVD